jgi:hypothetical protein
MKKLFYLVAISSFIFACSKAEIRPTEDLNGNSSPNLEGNSSSDSNRIFFTSEDPFTLDFSPDFLKDMDIRTYRFDEKSKMIEELSLMTEEIASEGFTQFYFFVHYDVTTETITVKWDQYPVVVSGDVIFGLPCGAHTVKYYSKPCVENTFFKIIGDRDVTINYDRGVTGATITYEYQDCQNK